MYLTKKTYKKLTGGAVEFNKLITMTKDIYDLTPQYDLALSIISTAFTHLDLKSISYIIDLYPNILKEINPITEMPFYNNLFVKNEVLVLFIPYQLNLSYVASKKGITPIPPLVTMYSNIVCGTPNCLVQIVSDKRFKNKNHRLSLKYSGIVEFADVDKYQDLIIPYHPNQLDVIPSEFNAQKIYNHLNNINDEENNEFKNINNQLLTKTYLGFDYMFCELFSDFYDSKLVDVPITSSVCPDIINNYKPYDIPHIANQTMTKLFMGKTIPIIHIYKHR